MRLYYYLLTLLSTKKLAQINNDTTKVTKTDEMIKPFLSDSTLITKATQAYPELLEPTPTKTINQYKKIYQKFIVFNRNIKSQIQII